MGFLKKKRDPLSKRARDLQKEIGELEEEIRRLTQRSDVEKANGNGNGFHENASNGQAAASLEPSPVRGIPRYGSSQPKIRSTTKPHGETTLHTRVTEVDAELATDPIFEEVKQNPFRVHEQDKPPQDGRELGIRRHDWVSLWQRLRNHLRGPVTSNPKLVNYLAAGSIQGLQPLRYERRVARNRFIALVVILVMILWGVLALLLKR